MHTTIIGREIVNGNTPTVLVRIGKHPSVVRLWIGSWFNREKVTLPVYVAYSKKECSPGGSLMLPMDSTVLKLVCAPGTKIWVCGEETAVINYAVDVGAQAALV